MGQDIKVTIEAILKDKKFKAGVKGMRTSAEKSAGGIKKAFKGIKDNFGKLVIGLGATVIAFKKLITVAKDFEKAIADVVAIIGGGKGVRKELELLAREAGKRTVFSATEAAGALKILAQAGLDAKESAATLIPTLNLATAADIDLTKATDVLVSQIKTFGLEMEDSADVADILVKATQSANQTMEDFSFAMKFAGSTAALVGISLEDTSAIISGLADNGIKGSLAGTAFRRSMLALIKPTDDAQKVLAKYGFTQEKLNELLPTPIKLFEELEKANIGVTEATTIFGARGLSMFKIIRDGIPRIKALQEAIENAGGAAKRAAETQINTLDGSLRLLRSAFEEIILSGVGDGGLVDMLKAIVDFLRRAVKGFEKFSPAVKLATLVTLTMVPALVALNAAFGAIGLILAGVAAGIIAVANAMGKSTEATNKNTEANRKWQAQQDKNKIVQQINALEELRKVGGRLNSLDEKRIKLLDGIITKRDKDNRGIVRSSSLNFRLSQLKDKLAESEDILAGKTTKLAKVRKKSDSEATKSIERQIELREILIDTINEERIAALNAAQSIAAGGAEGIGKLTQTIANLQQGKGLSAALGTAGPLGQTITAIIDLISTIGTKIKDVGQLMQNFAANSNTAFGRFASNAGRALESFGKIIEASKDGVIGLLKLLDKTVSEQKRLKKELDKIFIDTITTKESMEIARAIRTLEIERDTINKRIDMQQELIDAEQNISDERIDMQQEQLSIARANIDQRISDETEAGKALSEILAQEESERFAGLSDKEKEKALLQKQVNEERIKEENRIANAQKALDIEREVEAERVAEKEAKIAAQRVEEEKRIDAALLAEREKQFNLNKKIQLTEIEIDRAAALAKVEELRFAADRLNRVVEINKRFGELTRFVSSLTFLNKGGIVQDGGGSLPFTGLQSGAIIPGTGNTDSVPVLATPGEAFIDKDTTKGLMSIFKGINVPQFQQGGVVNNSSKSNTINLAGSNFNLPNVTTPQSFMDELQELAEDTNTRLFRR